MDWGRSGYELRQTYAWRLHDREIRSKFVSFMFSAEGLLPREPLISAGKRLGPMRGKRIKTQVA